MHTYSVDSNERVKIIAWMVIISYILTLGINYMLNLVNNLICNIELLDNIVSKIEFIGIDIRQFTLLAVFWGIYELFDKRLWKTKFFQKTCVKIPNLNGEWEGEFNSNYNGCTKGNAKLKIEQTWTKIRITSDNEQSNSYSRVAGILLNTNKGINIVYQYENRTNEKSVESMHDHRGYSDLIYKKDINNGKEVEILDGDYTGDQINRKAAGYIHYSKII
jgi:hypothetical protein